MTYFNNYLFICPPLRVQNDLSYLYFTTKIQHSFKFNYKFSILDFTTAIIFGEINCKNHLAPHYVIRSIFQLQPQLVSKYSPLRFVLKQNLSLFRGKKTMLHPKMYCFKNFLILRYSETGFIQSHSNN